MESGPRGRIATGILAPVSAAPVAMPLLGTEWADKRIKPIVRVESESPDRWGRAAHFD